jgi:hypothetical protein
MSEERVWKPVMDMRFGGYHPELKPERELEFRRGLDGEPSRFSLADQHPFFNIAGLYWRAPE